MNPGHFISTNAATNGLRRHLSVLSFAALTAVGCGQASPDDVAGGTEATKPADSTTASTSAGEIVPVSGPVTKVEGGQIYARLMHKENVEPEHVVEFYEFGPGDYLIREVMPADGGGKLLLNAAGKNATLTQVYKLAVPKATDGDIPAELVKADRLVAQLVAAAPVPPKGAASAASDGVGSVSQAEVDNPSTPVVIPPPNNGCSADEFGDNWGQQWFLSNNCSDLNFRDCQGNQQFFTIEKQTKTFIMRQMEGDFLSLGHSHGRTLYSTDCEGPWYDPVCTYPDWQVAWDFDVQPRQVIGMQTSGGASTAQKAAWGYSECGHGHRSFEWN